MNSRSVILHVIGVIGFWALTLTGLAPAYAQGGAPNVPDSGAAAGDTDGAKTADGATGDTAGDGSDSSGASDATTGQAGDAAAGTGQGSDGATGDGASGSATGEGDGATGGTDTGAGQVGDGASATGGGDGSTAGLPSDVAPDGAPDVVEGDGLGTTASGDNQALIQRDVAPTVIIYEGGDVRMRLGGLLQMHIAPFVGDDSLLDNDDIATSEGIRIRRARFGITGSFGKQFELQIVANPLTSDPDVGSLSTARLSYQFLPGFFVNVGTDSVPFTRPELESSAFLTAVERPLVARTIVPSRRLGVTVTGLVANRVGFIVGAMNGTRGYDDGNRFGGFLTAARLQFNLVGSPNPRNPKDFGLALSGGGLLDDGPATRALAFSADLLLTASGALVKAEFMCDRTTPQDAPMPAPGIAAEVTRCGGYGEVAYMLPRWKLQPMVRAEYFDDNTQIDDAGDSIIFTAGVNAEVVAFTRVQLHYHHRRERFGENRANDSLVMNLQGAF